MSVGKFFVWFLIKCSQCQRGKRLLSGRVHLLRADKIRGSRQTRVSHSRHHPPSQISKRESFSPNGCTWYSDDCGTSDDCRDAKELRNCILGMFFDRWWPRSAEIIHQMFAVQFKRIFAPGLDPSCNYMYILHVAAGPWGVLPHAILDSRLNVCLASFKSDLRPNFFLLIVST